MNKLPSILLHFSLLLFTFSFSGCYFKYAASSPTLAEMKYAGSGEQVKEHLMVENCGWYLFTCLPICCGDTDEEAFCPLTFFDDQCTSEIIEARFNERVKEIAAEDPSIQVRGINWVNDDKVTFDVPGFSFPLVIPYILTFRDRQISGTVVTSAPTNSQFSIINSQLVEVETTGWYLFDIFPIVSYDPIDGLHWFKDNVDAYTNMKLLDKEISDRHAESVGPIVSHETDEGILMFLLNRHAFRTSAVLYGGSKEMEK